MKDPHELPEERFEKLRKRRKFGPHTAKYRRHWIERCNGKQAYRSKEDTESMRAKLIARGKVTYLRIYKCPNCFKWHLTSKHG